MKTHPAYIMRDQVRDKVPSIMAYRLRNPAVARRAAGLPKPIVLALGVIVLNIALSAMAG